MKLEDVILYDDRASQPAANAVPVGTLYYVTDENVTERSNGSTWDDFSDAGSGAITSLTGDVTASGPGAAAATIANDAVTDAKLRESGALSVIGRSANSTGNPADISATPASGAVLRESGSTLGFGTVGPSGLASDSVTTIKILDGNVTMAKLADLATDSLIGRDTAGSGVPQAIGVTSGIQFDGSNNIRTTAPVRTKTVGIVIDGGGSTITTGVKGYIQVPVAGTITSAVLLADQSGAIVIDVWNDTYANYPPTDADSITASAPPTITASGVKSEDTTLSGWDTAVAAGDILGFNVDSVTAITRVVLELTILVTG